VPWRPGPSTLARQTRSGGFGFLGLDWAAVEALGRDIAIDQLDHGHGGAVAVAEAGLQDAV
jgi:hypothetical protein